MGHRFTAAVQEGKFIQYELTSKPAVKRFRNAMAELARISDVNWQIKGQASETHQAIFRSIEQLELSDETVFRIVDARQFHKNCSGILRKIQRKKVRK